jgi:serine/threonine protein kinase
MTLAAGTRLGPYEIVSELGAGGMGEVYRARDTRLERMVAVKVLPPLLSSSEQMRQRFEREARTISALSHPHICALYDVGREGETEYLVMELLEGETLSERVAKRPLPLEQTLRYGIEIADALDKAHRHGIVHRDLKPGNIMLTKSGVKLLDFGLAKAFAPAAPVESLTSAPTVARDVTREGTILGTLSYMAPEQLEGKETDSRTDIFALGAVLYEMATGRKAFSGASQASLISAILATEPPPLSSVHPMTPPAFDRLIRTCLAKDPAERWQSAHDVGLQLRAIQESAPLPVPREGVSRLARRAWVPWLFTAIAVALAATSLLRPRKPARSVSQAIRFAVPPPANGAFSYWLEASFLAISPDGSQLAYVASDSQGNKRVSLRPLSAMEARPIPATEGASSPFFSPDGRSIAFFVPGKLKRVELSGGAAVSICDIPPAGGMSGTWSRSGEILYAGVHMKAIYRVSAAGGTPAEAIRLDPARGEARIVWPSFLPDGKRFLYLLRHLDGHGDLILAEPGKKPRLVMAMQSTVQYADPGYLVFAREGSLLAQRFDPQSGQVTGEPFSVAEHVRCFLSTGSASFAASQAGTIAYQSQEDVLRLTWLDRAGRELGTVGTPGLYKHISLSADGRRLLFDRARKETGILEIWSLDHERGTETPIASAADTVSMPLWLPGGKVAYSAVRGSPPQLIRRDLATGKEEELVPRGGLQQAQDVSPDGRVLLYTVRGQRDFYDIWAYPLAGGGKSAPLLEAPFHKSEVRFSPDGRYLTMITTESGHPEVYVTAYPGPGERIRVSTGGAALARWSRDGRELFYLSGDRRLMSVPVRTSPSLQLGTPTPLFTLKGKGLWPTFEVSADGKRFLAVVPEVVADDLPLSVIVNWTSEVGR